MLFHPDYVREKIRASQLINRLHKCAFGEISLTMTQLRAIEILLRKCVPDLAAAEIKSEQTHRYVVEIPAVLTSEQWLEKYGKCDKETTYSLPVSRRTSSPLTPARQSGLCRRFRSPQIDSGYRHFLRRPAGGSLRAINLTGSLQIDGLPLATI
jgi:hypothetical protein